MTAETPGPERVSISQMISAAGKAVAGRVFNRWSRRQTSVTKTPGPTPPQSSRADRVRLCVFGHRGGLL